jgi:hypothetical protein
MLLGILLIFNFTDPNIKKFKTNKISTEYYLQNEIFTQLHKSVLHIHDK